jgi:dipeptidyl aminopeptidase/acylaminoacyl peptidase
MNEEQIEKMLVEFPKYDSSMTKDELGKIKTNVMIVVGDDDPFVPINKVVKVRTQLKKSNLMILPFSGHGAHQGEHWDFFLKTAKRFFENN